MGHLGQLVSEDEYGIVTLLGCGEPRDEVTCNFEPSSLRWGDGHEEAMGLLRGLLHGLACVTRPHMDSYRLAHARPPASACKVLLSPLPPWVSGHGVVVGKLQSCLPEVDTRFLVVGDDQHVPFVVQPVS